MIPKEGLSSDKLVQSLQSFWGQSILLAMNRCSIAGDQTSSENRNMLLTLVILPLLPSGNFVHFSEKCEFKDTSNCLEKVMKISHFKQPNSAFYQC